MLKKLARNDPYYNRNRPNLCSFYAKGACSRGDECPYRHEMPKPDVHGLGKQNIKDRCGLACFPLQIQADQESPIAVHGTNDPVARRMLSSVAASSGLAPPADESITSLYLTSVPSSHNTPEALTSFITPHLGGSSSASSIKGIVPVPATSCAFVNFKTRADAEEAAVKLAMLNTAPASAKVVKVSFGEQEMGVQWGRSRKPKVEAAKPATSAPTSEAVAA